MRVSVHRSALQWLRPPTHSLAQYLHTKAHSTLVLSSTVNKVTTLTMNHPAKCNSWSVPMLDMLYHKMEQCAKDDNTNVIILTGADPYYSSGGDISGYMKLQPQRSFTP